MDINKQKSGLWTRDFTIITLGTVVSMLGNAISGFAIGLLVLDYTGSTFLYALFAVVYSLPKIIMPFIAGPYLDRFSRKKAIYLLDFISAGLYVLIYFMLAGNFFNYTALLIMCFIIGSIDSTYQVAYESLYPTLIPEGHFSKAYSISSMIYPLSAIMVPIAAYFYENIGLEPLFLFNAVTFLIAAIFETQIKAEEKHVVSAEEKKKYDFSAYTKDFRDGISYLKAERGLLVITVYFVFSTLVGNISGTLMMPYFKANAELGVMNYTWVMGCSIVGRLIGGWIHYKFKYPTSKKFMIAMFVYATSSLIEGTFLFTPMKVMMLMQFISGFICVTSYNIRISSTQNYVPNEMRGRFNGTFQMLSMLGGIIGQLVAGAVGEVFPTPQVLLIANMLCVVFAFSTMFAGRRHVKPIYNVDL